MKALTIKALGRLLGLSLVMWALLFIPAWTLDYWQAWIFLIVYLGASLSITLYLATKDPLLLARRMRGGPSAEKSRVQKIIMSFASIVFIGLMVVPALDHRHGWSHMPLYLVLIGNTIVLLGWFCIFLVFKENSFGSATIEVVPGQKVIESGPYALIRHPMYGGGLVMLFGVPVALGSWWGVLVMLCIIPPLIWRLFEEETFLARELPGYLDYQKRVPFRLVPMVW